jgi:hypothetical protein
MMAGVQQTKNAPGHLTITTRATIARAVLLALVALALLASSGCFRYRTHVPGVIDMRTDAALVPVARARVKDVRESELLLLVGGRGVSSRGQQLIIEDRHFWVAGLIPLFNTDARDELAVLVDATGAARDLQIGEGQTAIDVLAALVLPNFVPLISYVLPSYTFHAHGTPIKLPSAPPVDDIAPPRRETPPESAPLPAPVDEDAPPSLLDGTFDPSDEGGEK